MEQLLADDVWRRADLTAGAMRKKSQQKLILASSDSHVPIAVPTDKAWVVSGVISISRFGFGPNLQQREVVGKETLEFAWVALAREIGVNDYDVDNLTDVFAEIDEALHCGKFIQLQQAIELLPMDELAPELLVAVLRAACPARAVMPRWRHLVSRVRSEIESRGLCSKQALAGFE